MHNIVKSCGKKKEEEDDKAFPLFSFRENNFQDEKGRTLHSVTA